MLSVSLQGPKEALESWSRGRPEWLGQWVVKARALGLHVEGGVQVGGDSTGHVGDVKP